ncbi:mannan chain length control protein LmeA [Gordonia sinesedis]
MARTAANKPSVDDPGRPGAPGERPAPLPHRTLRRTLLVTLAAILAAAAVTVVADAAAATRGEYRLSRSLVASPRISADPEVTLAGFPYLQRAASGSFSGVVVTARDVGVDGCRIASCRAELGATLGSTTVPDGWSIGPDDTLRTRSVNAYTRLDSVNLGRFLGILDLTVNTPAPEDKAGGGGPQDGLLRRSSGVLLTGTVALPPSSAPPESESAPQGRPIPAKTPSAAAYRGRSAKVSVSVDLSVRDGRLHLQATGFYTGPEEHVTADALAGDENADLRRQVLDRFSTTLPWLPLPWDLPATGAQSEGSDVLLLAESGPRDLRPDRF